MNAIFPSINEMFELFGILAGDWQFIIAVEQ